MKTRLAILTVLSLASSLSLMAGDVYRRIRVSDLPMPDQVPTGRDRDSFEERRLLNPVMAPYVVLDGPEGCEAHVSSPGNEWEGRSPSRSFLAVRAPAGRAVTGRIYFPNLHRNGMTAVPFSIPAADFTSESKEFYQAKEEHYLGLLQGGLPGGAWFRHQAAEAARAQGLDGKPRAGGQGQGRGFRRQYELEDTFELFSGGRAVSENLQLDRLMNIRGNDKALVDISTLKGVETKELDWKPLVAGLAPVADPLAPLLPADQHALFFPGFGAMTQLLDEAQANGTPVLNMLEPKAEDSLTESRYQTQLCTGLSDLSRLLGPRMIDSVAFTGSDPYLRVGTDVAALFETKQPEVLKAFILGRQALAQQANPAASKVAGKVGNLPYEGMVSPDRSICSYVAVVKGAVLVTNSLAQVGIMAEVAEGKKPPLSSLDEYTFFRHRYARTDREETAFLILSDATIRRWCSPRWRIADSRRTLAAAALGEIQAAAFAKAPDGRSGEGPVTHEFADLELGAVRMAANGPASEVYGGLGFMTPISELALPKVTQAEADAYTRWRQGYENNWSQFFDPIAIRFSVSKPKLGVEITVMPLIAGSTYRDYIDISKGAKIQPGDGDPHGAILHGITAINPQSEQFSSLGRMLTPMMPGLKANPFSWLGQTVSLYADPDPFWERLVKAESYEIYLFENYRDLPVALSADVSRPLELALFLTAFRGMVEQNSPGLTTWSSLTHNGKPYVKIAATGAGGDLSKLCLYYAATPKSLIVTLNEGVLKRALDRQAEREKPGAKPDPAARAWLGESQGVQAGPFALELARKVSREAYQLRVQALSWANLPILNEWKRLFPGQDPVKLHEERWGVRLVCPGGGTYTWNAEWNTMESSVFGHPGQPRDTSVEPALLSFTNANLGITFEPNGMSAKAVVERKTK